MRETVIIAGFVDRASEIKTNNEVDIRNFNAVYSALGAAAILPDDVAALYKMHYSAIERRLPDLASEIAGALYVGCHKHLILGVTALFRRYSAQAFRETRAAIEAAGIARAIRVDPENFHVFMEDEGTGKSRKTARERFTSRLLFPAEISQLSC